MRSRRAAVVCLCLTLFGFNPLALSANVTQVNRTDYAKKLRGMWLAESVANWTGITTEGEVNDAPFLTDSDWGTVVEEERGKVDFVFQNPWIADDDTNIEYIYLHLMNEHGTPLLTPEQIARGWDAFVYREENIWVSNLSALRLIRRGVLPPATGLGAVNSVNTREPPNYLMIDAQLTTEFFGALAPGAPEFALKISDLPIRNTAASFAAHAAQQFMVMYSLAAVVDPALSDRDKVIWLAKESRKYVPNTSKTADVFDFVLNDFLENCPAENAPGCQNWERTRDRIYQRYHRDAAANGFVYLFWYESAINYATGVMALLYGQGDLKRTIQVGTLSGWDSDNGTAAMGGLLGLMNGDDWVEAQFPGRNLSDRFCIHCTRSRNLPDYLPNDRRAEDTFTLMAERMLPLVEKSLRAAGGIVSASAYQLPALPAANQAELAPTHKLDQASANVQVRRQGGVVNVSTNTPGGRPAASVFADGMEHDFSGKEFAERPTEYRASGANVTLEVTYDREVTLKTFRFIEGGNHDVRKGYFRSVTPEALVGDEWKALPADTNQSAAITSKPYQIIDWVLPAAMEVRGIRLKGTAVGGFVSVIELDALAIVP